MKCITSPTLDDTQILSYVEGEVDDAIMAHIKECPYCAERVKQWTLFQNRLRARLYRSTCPSSIDLGDYHLGLLPDSRKLVVAQHVRECLHCGHDIAELEEFLTEPDARPDLLETVKVLFARMVSAGTTLAQALRGDEKEPFIYQAEDIQIVIDVQDDVDQAGFKILLGLVTGLVSNNFTIQVSFRDQVIATTSVDEIGNFIISRLAPGDYRLILTGPNIEMHIPSLPVK